LPVPNDTKSVAEPAVTTLPVRRTGSPANAGPEAVAPAEKAGITQAVPKAQGERIEPPPSIEGRDKTAYSELNIVVGMKNPGSVSVVVLDSSGAEVRRLFDGVLQAGKWSFDWDGRLDDHQAALPGGYRIEVRSGGVTQSREVNIR
jgi:hypothetical protein